MIQRFIQTADFIRYESIHDANIDKIEFNPIVNGEDDLMFESLTLYLGQRIDSFGFREFTHLRLIFHQVTISQRPWLDFDIYRLYLLEAEPLKFEMIDSNTGISIIITCVNSVIILDELYFQFALKSKNGVADFVTEQNI